MRRAGLLLPISSLPSAHGIGTLGRAAYEFVDFLAQAGQSWWQILPVGPTGYGDSPYQSFSAFAGNPYFVDLDLLVENDLLHPEEIGAAWGADPTRVDYGLLFEKRFDVLAKAAARQKKDTPEYMAFCDENADWLDDYALFMAIKEEHGQVGMFDWPAELRTRQEAALRAAIARLKDRIEFWRCVQFFFAQQWTALKTYANAQRVQLVGDIPIYISPDSSDLWAHPELFQTLPDGELSAVAGVPPDAFSATGQLWGNPLYDWAYHKQTGYRWWMRRLSYTAQLFDVSRIDHFRGFAGYYAIPAKDKTAEFGEWRPGPGEDFIRAIHTELPEMQIIAEDLGYLTDEVRALLGYSGYPGMKILQFAFDSREDNDYLPHNYYHHTVVYTGTHDNATTEEWQHTAARKDVKFARRYLGLTPRQDFTEAMVRAALSSVADSAVIPMQDWLSLGAAARINTPSTLGGRNWQWRLRQEQLTPALATRIRESTTIYGRLAPQAEVLEEKVFVQIKGTEALAEEAEKKQEALRRMEAESLGEK